MAEIVSYVDPDAVGAGNGTTWADAYTTLTAWEAGQQQDLTDGAGDNMVCYCRSLSGGDDNSSALVINGWTTSSACDIKIIAADGYRAKASGWDDSCYVLDALDTNGPDLAEDYVTLDGLQIAVTTNVAARYILAAEAQGANNLVIISNCRLRGNASTTVALRGIYSIDANTITRVYNTIVERTGTQARAVTNVAGTMNVFNCLSYGAYAGFYKQGGTMNIYNSVSLNNDDDFEGSPNVISYCASDDNDTTDATNVAEDGGGADWTGDFTDGSGGDWTLLAASNLVGATADRSAGLFTTDIDGTTRGAAWDVGPFEYVAAGGVTTIQAYTTYYANMRLRNKMHTDDSDLF